MAVKHVKCMALEFIPITNRVSGDLQGVGGVSEAKTRNFQRDGRRGFQPPKKPPGEGYGYFLELHLKQYHLTENNLHVFLLRFQ